VTIRFHQAWSGARELALAISDKGTDVVLVRDMLGRVSLILDNKIPDASSASLAEQLGSIAGAFIAPTPVRLAHELFDRDSILNSNDLIIERERAHGHGRLAILERGVVGADWTRPSEEPSARRITLYGFKGGVGRSTATFMLAKHLAGEGKSVLVVDLDLESPGLGALAQRDEDLPEYGVVDHLVEAAVGNADGLDLVSRSLLITGGGNGEVWLAPAAGQLRAGYLAKLNRIYSDLPAGPSARRRSFGDRLDAAIAACEAQVETRSRKPDVVLLDSRAGIHDIAAVALSQLGGLNLLFAADNPQTWSGYRALFEQWQTSKKPRELGERLQMVSSMTPDKGGDAYLASFRDHAQECLADTLYEDVEDGQLDAFTFGVDDINAPHSPLPISFNSDLVGLDPIRQPDWHAQPLVRAAFEIFLGRASELIIEGER
jgi:hypothetical protein